MSKKEVNKAICIWYLIFLIFDIWYLLNSGWAPSQVRCLRLHSVGKVSHMLKTMLMKDYQANDEDVKCEIIKIVIMMMMLKVRWSPVWIWWWWWWCWPGGPQCDVHRPLLPTIGQHWQLSQGPTVLQGSSSSKCHHCHHCHPPHVMMMVRSWSIFSTSTGSTTWGTATRRSLIHGGKVLRSSCLPKNIQRKSTRKK